MLRVPVPKLTVHYSILLAGGLSSRMGEDKAELPIEGESLLQRGLKLLNATGSELILVSGRDGNPSAVPDIIPHSGPPGGVYSCLEYLLKFNKLDDNPLLLMPVDMPFLNTDVLTALLNAIEGVDACHFEGEVFPCVVRASENLRLHLEKLFTESHELGGKRSMRAVLKFCNSKSIAKNMFAEEVFRNINTPADYSKALSN